MGKKTLGFSATIISAIMFGFLPLLVKTICAGGTNTLSCVVLRFSVALPLVYIFVKLKGISLKITARQFVDAILISAFGFGGTSVLLFSSYNYIPSGMSTTIHYMYPMLTIFACAIFYKERSSKLTFLALILCVTGIICFYQGEGGANLTGIILAAASSFTYMFYTIYLGHSSLKDLNDFTVLFYITLCSDVVIFIMALLTNQIDFTITPKAWLVVLIFAILASFVGSLGYQIGVRYIGGQTASILSTFEPVTSVIIGYLAFDEVLTARSIVGCIAILAAVVVTSFAGGSDEENS